MNDERDKQILDEYENHFWTTGTLARKYKVSRQYIHRIIKKEAAKLGRPIKRHEVKDKCLIKQL